MKCSTCGSEEHFRRECPRGNGKGSSLLAISRPYFATEEPGPLDNLGVDNEEEHGYMIEDYHPHTNRSGTHTPVDGDDGMRTGTVRIDPDQVLAAQAASRRELYGDAWQNARFPAPPGPPSNDGRQCDNYRPTTEQAVAPAPDVTSVAPVSYTHLTLPTKA